MISKMAFSAYSAYSAGLSVFALEVCRGTNGRKDAVGETPAAATETVALPKKMFHSDFQPQTTPFPLFSRSRWEPAPAQMNFFQS